MKIGGMLILELSFFKGIFYAFHFVGVKFGIHHESVVLLLLFYYYRDKLVKVCNCTAIEIYLDRFLLLS